MPTLIDWDGLRDKGIPYSREHIQRLMRNRKFPRAVKLSDGPTSPNFWLENEIDQFIEDRIAARGAAAA
jgi:prophage regulatory protein